MSASARRARAHRRATAAAAQETLPTNPHHIQVDCSSGATRLAALPTETAMTARAQELKDFTALCKGMPLEEIQDALALSSSGISVRRRGSLIGSQELRIHFGAFLKLLHKGNMKVNGEGNNWSNGFLGSRWCDFSFHGKTIRYAYYNPNSDDNNNTGKHAILQMAD